MDVSRLRGNSNFCILFMADVLSPNFNIIILGADGRYFIPFNDIVEVRIHERDGAPPGCRRGLNHVMIRTVNVMSSYLENSTSNTTSAARAQVSYLYGLKEPALLKKAILSLKEQALIAATTAQPAAAAAASCVTASSIEMVATSVVDNNQEAVNILREIRDRLAQQNELLEAQRKAADATRCTNTL